MPKFLSQEWADGLTEKLNADDGVQQTIEGQDVLTTTTVTGGPDGDVSYYLLIESGSATVGIGAPEYDPDVEGTIGWDDAVAMSKGELPPQTAMMTGRLKSQGNLSKIMPLAPAFEKLPVFEREIGTTY